MIRVDIRRRPDRSITGFTMSGHADYDEHGKDIVCAGVTAVSFGTVNAIEALLHVDLQPNIPSRGQLEVIVPTLHDEQVERDLQLLLESMVQMIKGIESSYRPYLKLKETII